MVGRYVPPLSCDLADLKACIIAAVKNIDAPMLTCVPCHPWGTYRTSLVDKKTFFNFPAAVNNSIKVGPLVFLL
jgi:hypothetical protein